LPAIFLTLPAKKKPLDCKKKSRWTAKKASRVTNSTTPGSTDFLNWETLASRSYITQATNSLASTPGNSLAKSQGENGKEVEAKAKKPKSTADITASEFEELRGVIMNRRHR
jgi:hypothetical protein